MYFLKLDQKLYSEQGKFCGVEIEVAPIFTNNRNTDIAIYRELWHRLRRDHKLSRHRSDPGAIYFTEASNITYRTFILISNGEGHYSSNAEADVKETIEHMDELLTELILSGQYDSSLTKIALKIQINRDAGEADLKRQLKIFCRSQKMLVDDNDASYAAIQAKNRRREAFFADHPEHKRS